MKIIHSADLHLNSALTTNFNTKLAKKINDNVFLSLEKMLEFASQNNVEAIIFAGDLFDKDTVAHLEQEKFKSIVSQNKNITFIFVYGNHDYSPKNSFNFGENFITLLQGESIFINSVCFYALAENINLKEENFNIVIAHGDTNKDINLPKLKDKNIDYLALGHIHQNSLNSLDARGVYAYSGSLSARGFDELGNKGFYLIDTQSKTYTFKSINGITFNKLSLDITGLTDLNFYAELGKILPQQNPNLALKVTLYGEICHLNIDLNYLKDKYASSYLYIDFILDATYKAKENNLVETEFIKVVKSQNYSPDIQEKIIRLGVKTLK